MTDALVNALQTATQKARTVLETEVSEQLLSLYNVHSDGRIEDNPSPRATPNQVALWRRIVASVEHERASGKTPAEAVAAFRREAAFTLLNRFVALKMLEARDLIPEAVSKGEESRGFKNDFTLLAPGLSALPDKGYRLFLETLFDELGQEVRVLFDRRHVPGQIWPERPALVKVLGVLNDPVLDDAWTDEEAIGWVYQFFNSDQENRDSKYDAKGKPKAPQNGQELAVRNQFFTPDYVVRFLVDNTLGRLWWEMRRGDTVLADTCPHLIHRPNETFLAEGEDAPEPSIDGTITVPYRAKKDPRDIRLLDPACGSMHFGLYAFDLFERIYEEAWHDAESSASEVTGHALRDDYTSLDALRREIPALILAHNIYGVDIDGRTAQIAGLALWMRAQTAWQRRGIRPQDRPPIRKTNVVAAEPMPGEPALRREFLDALQPPALRVLVEAVFEHLELAGEAGLLLPVEQAVAGAVRQAQERWETRDRQLALIPEPDARQDELFDAQNLPPADFWDHAEARVYDALRTYAERGGGGLTRRLFAEDAAAGFAFVDLCRLRYDVAVMNPPFGTATPALDTLIAEHYPSSKMNLFAPFVERAVRTLVPDGFVGVLSTEVGFFQRTAEAWRRMLLEESTLSAVAHLGDNVLKGARVRVAAYTLRTGEDGGDSLFLRVLEQTDRENLLLSVIENVNAGAASPLMFTPPQEEFEKLPYAAFGYWCSPELRNAFSELPRLGDELATVAQGLATAKDFRFLRLRWELPIGPTGASGWMPFAKGGDYSPFHDDVHLHVNWTDDGAEVYAFPNAYVRNPQHYGKPGLTYPPRTNKRFAPRVLPTATAFGHKGPAIVDMAGDALALAAVLNSRSASYLLTLGTGMAEAKDQSNSYEVGLVQRLPVPPNALSDADLAAEGRAAWATRAEADLADETTALFVAPADPLGPLPETHRQRLARARELNEAYVGHQHAIDARVRAHYALSDADWEAITDEIPEVHVPVVPSDTDKKARQQFGHEVLQYLVGVAFGRWDVRYATGERPSPGLPDPFAALPACSPGMLQDADGRPPSTPPEGYPVAFPTDGLLVDDEGVPRDLIGRVRLALTVLYGDDASAAEADLLDLLGESSLTDYLRKSGGFFKAHLQAYSKSRRKAPVYWPLSTVSGGYTIWLYYPRLTRSTLYDALHLVTDKVAFEEGKLRRLEGDLAESTSASDRKDLDDQRDFVAELRVFRSEIEAVAPLWSPDLTDGVLINFAPLYRLFTLYRAWQKDLETTWRELAAGDHEWAHLALHLWPEAVVPQCAERLDLALAHGLENVFFERQSDGSFKKRLSPTQSVEALIAERQSPAVQAARNHLL